MLLHIALPQADNILLNVLKKIHSFHLPEDDENTLSLLDLTVEVIRRYSIQLLDTGYLIPYGLVGSLAKCVTGVAHVIRHGGSDIEKFVVGQILDTLLSKAFGNAELVITNERYYSILKPMSSRLVVQPAYVPDDKAFASRDGRHRQNRIGIIGKINHYWQHKNLRFTAEIMRQLTGQFECCVVGQGNGLSDFQASLGPDIVDSFRWLRFVAPWEMPRLLSQFDAIFLLESQLPYGLVSNLALEATGLGVGIITDRADFAESYRSVMKIDQNNIIVVSSSETSTSASQIKDWIAARERRRILSRQLLTFNDYLMANEALYASVVGGH
jgi:hypothetical protein